MVGRFPEVCRRGLRVDAGKSKVMVMNGEEGMEREVHVDFRACSKFKYLGRVLDESGTDGVDWEESCRCHQVPG